MKTRFKKTSIMFIAASTVVGGWVVGCKAPDSPTEPEVSLQVGITTQIVAPTYAADKASKIAVDDGAKTTTFEVGDQIGLYLVEFNLANTAQTDIIANGNQTDNHPYTYSATGWVAANLTNPLTWRKFNAFAYHPYSAAVTNALAIKHTVRTNQSAGITPADYLMWSGRSAAATPVKGEKFTLNFTHKLTRLIVNIALPTTYNSETITKISAVTTVAFPTQATLNLLTGVSTAGSTKGQVTMFRSAGSGADRTGTFVALVVPTTIAEYQPVVQIDYTTSTGSGTLYYYAPKGGITFSENQIYTLTLNAKELIFGKELTPFIATSAVDQTTTVVSSDAALKWNLASDDAWVTFSVNGGAFVSTVSNQTGNATIAVRVANNATGQPRLSALTLSSTDPLYTTVPRQLVVRQN